MNDVDSYTEIYIRTYQTDQEYMHKYEKIMFLFFVDQCTYRFDIGSIYNLESLDMLDAMVFERCLLSFVSII